MMTEEEIYEFDLNGYIIYRNVLEPSQVRDICSVLEQIQDNGKFSFFELDPCFIELMALPSTISILQAMLGDWLRFDHAFGIKMTKGFAVKENLHAGPLQNQRAFWYQWVPNQGMHNGLIKVMYAMCDAKSGDGGFICVPGSHKGNVYYRPPLNSHLVVNPTLMKGDMLIFTESLVHGSKKWVADHTRWVLIYSYAPGCVSWKHYETIKRYLALATNEIQRRLLRPPYVGDYDELESPGTWLDRRRSPIR